MFYNSTHVRCMLTRLMCIWSQTNVTWNNLNLKKKKIYVWTACSMVNHNWKLLQDHVTNSKANKIRFRWYGFKFPCHGVFVPLQFWNESKNSKRYAISAIIREQILGFHVSPNKKWICMDHHDDWVFIRMRQVQIIISFRTTHIKLHLLPIAFLFSFTSSLIPILFPFFIFLLAFLLFMPPNISFDTTNIAIGDLLCYSSTLIYLLWAHPYGFWLQHQLLIYYRLSHVYVSTTLFECFSNGSCSAVFLNKSHFSFNTTLTHIYTHARYNSHVQSELIINLARRKFTGRESFLYELL